MFEPRMIVKYVGTFSPMVCGLYGIVLDPPTTDTFKDIRVQFYKNGKPFIGPYGVKPQNIQNEENEELHLMLLTEILEQ